LKAAENETESETTDSPPARNPATSRNTPICAHGGFSRSRVACCGADEQESARDQKHCTRGQHEMGDAQRPAE
jgi:hypothetical protein